MVCFFIVYVWKLLVLNAISYVGYRISSIFNIKSNKNAGLANPEHTISLTYRPFCAFPNLFPLKLGPKTKKSGWALYFLYLLTLSCLPTLPRPRPLYIQTKIMDLKQKKEHWS